MPRLGERRRGSGPRLTARAATDKESLVDVTAAQLPPSVMAELPALTKEARLWFRGNEGQLSSGLQARLRAARARFKVRFLVGSA